MVRLFSQSDDVVEDVQRGGTLKNDRSIQEEYLTDVVLEKCKKSIRVKKGDQM